MTQAEWIDFCRGQARDFFEQISPEQAPPYLLVLDRKEQVHLLATEFSSSAEKDAASMRHFCDRVDAIACAFVSEMFMSQKALDENVVPSNASDSVEALLISIEYAGRSATWLFARIDKNRKLADRFEVLEGINGGRMANFLPHRVHGPYGIQ